MSDRTIDPTALGRLPVHPGLCATCRHLRLLASPRSVFVRCARARVDPGYVRYPPLPVRACPGYEPEPGQEGADAGPGRGRGEDDGGPPLVSG